MKAAGVMLLAERSPTPWAAWLRDFESLHCRPGKRKNGRGRVL
jgi:hypothetical protein